MKTSRFWPLVFAGAVVASPVSAAAQFARHAYDITSYDLNIHPNFATGHISLRVCTTIQRANDTDTFRFSLSPRYQDVSVRVNGRPVALMRSGNTIAVSNPSKTNEVVLEFSLAGMLGKSEDEERHAIEPDSLFLLWSDRFYPVDYADWAAVRTAILLPDDMPVIAPGVETSATRTSAGTWHIFESRTPAVKFSVLADRLWIRQASRIGRLQMTTLLHPEVASLAPALHRTSADIIRYFTHLHGYYPADAFAFVTVRGMFARRAFSGFIGYEPEYLTRTMQVDGYDAHETSLLWWGYAAHGEGPGAFQWTEGFGDYVEVLYTQDRRIPLSVNLRGARDRYQALSSTSDVPIRQLGGSSPQAVIHGKLPWRMDAVRQQIGDSRFRVAIRELFDRFKWRTFTLDEFVSVFEAFAPPALRKKVRTLLQE